MLCDVARRDLSVKLLGTSLPAPVLLAPVGAQSILHPEAEVAVARAAASTNMPFVLSTASSRSIEEVAQAPEENPQAAITHFISIFSNPALTWNNLAFLRQHTRLPIVLKGIMHPADALKAIEYNMDGIIVSNHGGRQVDGARAALDALADIVPAVQERMPILFDSGIRGGADAFKALALERTPFYSAASISGVWPWAANRVYTKSCSISWQISI